MLKGQQMTDRLEDDPIVKARVARALLSGPATIRDGATVADMD
jgi:hypothetical protein